MDVDAIHLEPQACLMSENRAVWPAMDLTLYLPNMNNSRHLPKKNNLSIGSIGDRNEQFNEGYN